MTLRWFYLAAAAALLVPGAVRAQDSAPPPPPGFAHVSLRTVPPPALPYDPLELVTTEAQPTDDPVQRAAALALLEHARGLSNVRAHAYDLNTIFTSVDTTGQSAEWALEDASPARDIYRWSADGPGYSGMFLAKDGLLSSNRPTNDVPLRVEQVRDAIFFAYTWAHQHASVRTSAAALNGAELQCVLIAHDVGTHTPTGARNWNEYEYCVDAGTGLLATYSPVPGIYYHYDYADAVHFHGTIIPGGFTISEGGREVVEARTLSVTDPVGASAAMFSGDGLTPLGTGPSTEGPEIYSVVGSRPPMSPQGSNSPLAQQIVVVAAIAGKDGHLNEPEILATTAEELNETAIDSANKFANMQCGCGPGTAPGAVHPSHEVIYVICFYNGTT